MNTVPKQWSELDQKTQLEFLLDGKIRMEDWYITRDAPNQPKEKFLPEKMADLKARAKKRETWYYGPTDQWLYDALESKPITGQTVAIMGSVNPWYEAIALDHGAKVTTIDYYLPGYNDPEIEEVSVTEYWKTSRRFDAAISISSFEHDGLGRYGDPINPIGDLRAMNEMRHIIKQGGLLYLAVPVGLDKIVWNAHRIYGAVRLPKLVEGWELVGAVGYEDDLLYRNTGREGGYQPVIVLKNP